MRYYTRLATTGIKNNKRMYVPYMLACSGMVMMYYIIKFLSDCKLMDTMKGGTSCSMILRFGAIIVSIFSVLFMFYTNSFIMKKRKKEFGLYNILGMSKKHIFKIIVIENAIVAVVTIIAGVIFGILFSKLAELALVNVMSTKVDYSFEVSILAVKKSVAIFGFAFAALVINAFRQVFLAKPINLLRSENVGEKPPKANWLLGILSIGILGWAYYMAVSIKQPLKAIPAFFKAVLLVVVGSYILFIAGSVMICKMLQKSKRYYYKKNHFIPVASMTYRMKRNGAGLASICVLSTMVLVMISSSACLFFGEEESLYNSYPRRYSIEIVNDKAERTSDEQNKIYNESMDNMLKELNVKPENIVNFRYTGLAGRLMDDGIIEVDRDGSIMIFDKDYDKVIGLYYVPESDYERYFGVELDLKPGEAFIYNKGDSYNQDFVKIEDFAYYNIVGRLDEFMPLGNLYTEMFPMIVLVIPDYDAAYETIASNPNLGDLIIYNYWDYSFDSETDLRDLSDIENEDGMLAHIEKHFKLYESFSYDDREIYKEEFFGTFGGLFFIGIILSIVFIAATVLIIYYKQVSEGVEDQAKFEIMKKVGMTKKEIRKSINSQMLVVFFLPVIVAIVHLSFAFPMIEKMLLLFDLDNKKLFLSTSAIAVLVFSIIYTIVYKLTSNVYFNIVNSKEK